MSEYFTNIPNIYYKFDQITDRSGKKVDKIHEKLTTNITLRQKLKSSIRDDLLTFYTYRVKDGERPDTIAQIYYGSVKFTWLVFVSNNIFDPIFEWPMSHSELETHIAKKYGSLDSAISTVHHYEEIIQSYVEAGAGNPRIDERTIEIDSTRFLALSSAGKTNTKTITNYDYELNYNEQKKEITLIEDIYAEDILQNARNLFGSI